PLLLQDKALTADGQLDIASLGETMTINGVVGPWVELPAQVVRLRALNGSTERTYNIGVSDERLLYQIGTDNGLLASTNPVTRLRLSPGERVEFLVNLSGAQGQHLQLVSYASELPANISGGTGGTTALDGVDFELLELRVV